MCQRSVELLTDGKDCQTPVGCIGTRTESFISLASPLDLQRAFSEPGFVTKVDKLVVETQTLDAVECSEKFVCVTLPGYSNIAPRYFP